MFTEQSLSQILSNVRWFSTIKLSFNTPFTAATASITRETKTKLLVLKSHNPIYLFFHNNPYNNMHVDTRHTKEYIYKSTVSTVALY